jgi:hypothetical protein
LAAHLDGFLLGPPTNFVPGWIVEEIRAGVAEPATVDSRRWLSRPSAQSTFAPNAMDAKEIQGHSTCLIAQWAAFNMPGLDVDGRKPAITLIPAGIAHFRLMQSG